MIHTHEFSSTTTISGIQRYILQIIVQLYHLVTTTNMRCSCIITQEKHTHLPKKITSFKSLAEQSTQEKQKVFFFNTPGDVLCVWHFNAFHVHPTHSSDVSEWPIIWRVECLKAPRRKGGRAIFGDLNKGLQGWVGRYTVSIMGAKWWRKMNYIIEIYKITANFKSNVGNN